MKDIFNSSTITGGSINFSSPTITKTDDFATTTATHPGVLTYTTIRP